MEGDFVRSETMAFKVHFYPRPHMEGDRWQQQTRTQAGISTHALTWRATPRLMTVRRATAISTHALTWRATGVMSIRADNNDDFYPRPHMEGDPYSVVTATSSTYFYPRPHMEGDCKRG